MFRLLLRHGGTRIGRYMNNLCSESEVAAKLNRASTSYQDHIAKCAGRIIQYPVRRAKLGHVDALNLYRLGRPEVATYEPAEEPVLHAAHAE